MNSQALLYSKAHKDDARKPPQNKIDGEQKLLSNRRYEATTRIAKAAASTASNMAVFLPSAHRPRTELTGLSNKPCDEIHSMSNDTPRYGKHDV